MPCIITKVFRDVKHTPFDRECFITNAKNEKIHFLTMGAASYISRVKLELYSSFKRHVPHVLIGRFSSLSWDLKFLMGYNHCYKNVVTTYSVYRTDLLKQIYSQMTDTKLPDITTCKDVRSYNNRHQIIVGNDVWIGRGVTLMGGVKIGNGAIIGLNSTVTKDIPPYAIAAGNPARVVKYRFDPETIKKFMAVKWWNWDVKKILENAPLNNDPDEFLKKYYSPELAKIPYERSNIGGGGDTIEKLRADGRKIYSFVADFHAPRPLWKRIVNGFCKSTSSDAVLLIWLGKDCTEEDINDLKNFAKECGLSGQKIIQSFPSTEEKIFSPYILRNTTHFITTREMISLECMDWLWDTDVKIVSALDEGIFDGESKVDWNKIFGK